MSLYNIKSPTSLSLILLMGLSLITSTLAVGDCSNPLLATFSFTGLASPEAVTGLNFCKSLQSGQSCCSATIINDFQNKANTLSTSLQTIAKTRDQFIVNTRDQTIPTLTIGLTSLKTAAAAAVTFLQEKVTAGDTTFASGRALTNQQALDLNTVLKRITTQVTDSLSTLKTGLTAFQNARSTCMTELLKLQASAWCLSCDPDYATKGVAGTGATTAITLSTSVCSRLQTACFDYITDSVTQSNIILAKKVGTAVTNAIAAVTKIGGDDASGLDDLATVIQGLTATTTVAEQPVQLPTGCTSATNCPYICQTLISVSGTTAGTISQDDANRGGSVNTELTVSSGGSGGSGGRILLDGGFLSSEPGSRLLLANEWSPAADESGITVSFPADPAGVNPQPTETTTTTNSAPKLISGVLCLVGALVGALLI